MRARLGEYAGWDVNAYLGAKIADSLAILIWQQTKDGHSDKPKHFPKPTWRPGDIATDDTPSDVVDEQTFGKKGMTISEVDAYFARRRKPAKRAPKTRKAG